MYSLHRIQSFNSDDEDDDDDLYIPMVTKYSQLHNDQLICNSTILYLAEPCSSPAH